MTISLPVSEVRKSKHLYERGRFRLAVMGVLIVDDKNARIVDCPSAVAWIAAERSKALTPTYEPDLVVAASIPVCDDSSIKRLEETVEPGSPGPIRYLEVAMICACTKNEGADMELHSVWDAVIYRENSENNIFNGTER